MTSRYRKSRTAINDHESYKEMFQKRGVTQVTQLTNPNLSVPTAEDITQLQLVGHIWSIGDRLYKLAYEYYGDSTLWWIIAQFNKMPTENHIALGDLIYIPLPLEKVMQLIRK